MEKLVDALVKNYLYLGLFFMALGVIYILASIKNWTWLIKPNFEDALRNRMFGKNSMRIRFGLLGVAFFVAGVIFVLTKFM